jgi:hypothetical protein
MVYRRQTHTHTHKYEACEFDICGSVHHHLINKTTNVMQLRAIVFIIPWKALHMFRVLFTAIIRSVLKLYMQLLVQSRIGMVSRYCRPFGGLLVQLARGL